jgi:hypothetical protein
LTGPAWTLTPHPSLHLLAGLWVASRPTCGYQLTTARTASSNGPRSVYKT